MMGMGQQMPMRRPPTGPSQMTAGRPNPMAGWQGRPPGGGMPAGPNFQPPPQQWGGGGSEATGGGYQAAIAPRTEPPPPGWQQHNNVQGIGVDPRQLDAMGPQAGMGGSYGSMGPPAQQQFGPMYGEQMGGGMMPMQQMQGAIGGMSDAMMHPFAPRNRPQFPGAAQGGIMGGMGGGPQMGQRRPPMPPWAQMGGQPRWL